MTIDIKNVFGRVNNRKFVDSSGRLVFQVNDIFKCYAKHDENNTGISLATNSNDLLFVGDLRDITSKTGNVKHKR